MPGSVYDTVRELRTARGARLGAAQRKLPPLHFYMMGALAAIELAVFPLLGAATADVTETILAPEALLFGSMSGGIALVLIISLQLWSPVGRADDGGGGWFGALTGSGARRAYSVDAVRDGIWSTSNDHYCDRYCAMVKRRDPHAPRKALGARRYMVDLQRPSLCRGEAARSSCITRNAHASRVKRQVLDEMVAGLRDELENRRRGVRFASSALPPPPTALERIPL